MLGENTEAVLKRMHHAGKIHHRCLRNEFSCNIIERQALYQVTRDDATNAKHGPQQNKLFWPQRLIAAVFAYAHGDSDLNTCNGVVAN